MRDTLTLYRIAERRGIDVDFVPLRTAQSLSIPVGKRGAIALDPRKMAGSADERVKLSHELGHCLTGSFYPEGSGVLHRRRCERRADRWAISALVPYRELRRALRRGVTTVWELADYFEVTESFMRKALTHYRLLESEQPGA